jgi:hypothetical protein
MEEFWQRESIASFDHFSRAHSNPILRGSCESRASAFHKR